MDVLSPTGMLATKDIKEKSFCGSCAFLWRPRVHLAGAPSGRACDFSKIYRSQTGNRIVVDHMIEGVECVGSNLEIDRFPQSKNFSERNIGLPTTGA